MTSWTPNALFASVKGIPHLTGWVGREIKVTRGVKLSSPFNFSSDYGRYASSGGNAFHAGKQ